MSKCNIPCAGSKASIKIGANKRQGAESGQGLRLPVASIWHQFQVAAKRVLDHSATRSAPVPIVFAQPIRLEAHQLWSGGTPSPVRIFCESGTLWVTRQGDLRDYILREGEEIMAPHTPRLVISSLGGPSVFRIQAPGSR